MAKATISKAVLTSCKNTKVRTASGGCAPERKPMMKKGGSTKSFPDLNKDGKITRADILIGKKVIPKAKKGGAVKDDKWIQKAVNPAHKGFCTPMTKPTCTPKRKALALTLKKIAKNK